MTPGPEIPLLGTVMQYLGPALLVAAGADTHAPPMGPGGGLVKMTHRRHLIRLFLMAVVSLGLLAAALLLPQGTSKA